MATGGKLVQRLNDLGPMTIRRIDAQGPARDLESPWEKQARDAIFEMADDPGPRSLVLFAEADSVSFHEFLLPAAKRAKVTIYPVLIRSTPLSSAPGAWEAANTGDGPAFRGDDVDGSAGNFSNYALELKKLKVLANETSGRVTTKADSLAKDIIGQVRR